MNLKAVRWDIVSVSLGLFGCVLIILTVNLTLTAENETRHVTEAYQGFQDGKCQSCHPAIWREWENSMHAKAWVDEIYQAAAQHIPDRETKCDQCHAPQPILITGIGEMPKLRNTQREAGSLMSRLPPRCRRRNARTTSQRRNLFPRQRYQSDLYRTHHTLCHLPRSRQCSRTRSGLQFPK